jgi:hypothetical protein
VKLSANTKHLLATVLSVAATAFVGQITLTSNGITVAALSTAVLAAITAAVHYLATTLWTPAPVAITAPITAPAPPAPVAAPAPTAPPTPPAA